MAEYSDSKLEQYQKQDIDQQLQISIEQKFHIEQKPENYSTRQKYYQFFNSVIPNSENYIPKTPSETDFKTHKIKYLSGNRFQQNLQSFHKPYIRVKYTQRSATIVVYIVIIAKFELEITLLNVDSDANGQQIKIGEGSFGSVRIQSQSNRKFVVKRQMFKNKQNLKQFNMMANKYEIEQAIIQLCIYKICSLFEIGPAAETDIGFDLICYRDCIEFQIELCLKIEYKHGIYVDQSKFQKEIKQCLFILHQCKIIHKDIKPSNILFSIKYNKYVLTDFGISHPVIAKIGQLSETFRQGTNDYMSQQMIKIQQGQKGYVHLYGNDLYSLSIILLKKKKINQNIEESLKLFQKFLINLSKSNYQYEYLKLKYFCIKPDHHINNSLIYWQCMNTDQKCELISIVSKSMDFDKIRSVYNQLSQLKQFGDYLQSLRKQAISIKQMNIYEEVEQQRLNNQIQLKNTLRVYDYSQQVNTIIEKLMLEPKYPKTMQYIRILKQKQYFVNLRDQLFDSNKFCRKYARKLKQQISQYQQLNNIHGIFQNYIFLLNYCNHHEVIDIIAKLRNLKYTRTKSQQIQEKIMINYRIKNKQCLQLFLEQMAIKDIQRDFIIDQLELNMQVGQIYYHLHKYQIALRYFLKAQKQQIYFHGQLTPHIASIYNNIGLVYTNLCKYKQALHYLNTCLKIETLLAGQYQPKYTKIYNSIAYNYMLKGDYTTCLIYYFKSLNIVIKYFGEQHYILTNIYNNIATIYQCMSKYQMSLHYYNKILNINLQIYGQAHLYTAKIYHNIGSVYIWNSDYKKAVDYQNKSLNIFLKYHRQKQDIIANIYKNLGIIYKQRGEYEIALNYLTKSLNINIQYFGEKHLNVASNYDNLAEIYLKMGKYQQALKILNKNISTWINLMGQQNIHIAITYNHIGDVYKSKGEYEIALNYIKKALKINKQYFDHQHPNIIARKNQIGQINYILGKYDEALANFLDSLQIYQKTNDPRVAVIYNNIGLVYIEKGQYQTALHYYKKSIEFDLNIQNYGKLRQQLTAHTFNNIGKCKFLQEQFQQAHSYTYRSIKIRKKYLGNNHPDLKDNYHLLFLIFYEKNERKKSILYLNMTLQILLKSNQTNHLQQYSLYRLGRILQKIKKYLESYFIYKLFLQLFDKDKTQSQKNQKEIKKAKKRIKSIQIMRQLYFNHHQLNRESLTILKQKYTKLSKNQLFRILKTKKLFLKTQQKYRQYTKPNFIYDELSQQRVQKLIQCIIQICLCYKYLKYISEVHKTFIQLNNRLQKVSSTSSKQEFYRDLKQLLID